MAMLIVIVVAPLAIAAKLAPKDAICIEYVGPSDKPTHGLAISTSTDGIDLCRKEFAERVELVDAHVVSYKVMEQLFNIARSVPIQKPDRGDLTDFAMAIVGSNHQKQVYTLNRALLNTVKSSCTDRALRSYLGRLESQSTP